MFKAPTLSKKKKEKNNTRKLKRFLVSLNKFKLDDDSDVRIIDKFEAFNVSKSITRI